MNRFFAPFALLDDGWRGDVGFDVDDAGTIVAIQPGSLSAGATLLGGCVVPGMPNAHSHVFQRALAGRAEGVSGDDSFWEWRNAMYAFVNRLEPEAFEALAADAYREMLEAGYTSVAEFHYLHHAFGGARYARRSEMGRRVLAAAETAGIGLTLLPVFYRFGDFGGVEAGAGQSRFVNDLETFAGLWSELHDVVADRPLARLGLAPHSLRAVSLPDLAELVRLGDARTPIHIHISEQTREVDACRARHGTTPVELLYASVDVDERWALVHATHATRAERERIAASGAVVVLCPTTEANLGDGIFAAEDFVRASGRIAIGSDSNVSIDVAEELRWLEYGQRLAALRRAVIRTPGQSLGDGIFRRCAGGGRQALAQPVGSLSIASRADFVVLHHPGAESAPSMDRYVFASRAWRVRDVFVAGRRMVESGRHIERDAIVARAELARAALG